MEAGVGGEDAEFWSRPGWRGTAARTSVALWGSAALAFIGTVIAARGLGPSEFGAVVLAVATATFVSTFLDLTLEDGVVHHGFRVLRAGDLSALRSLLRVSLVFDLIIGILIAGLIVGLAEPIAEIVSGGELDPNLIRLAALVTLASTIDGTTGAVLLLAGRAELRGWTSAANNLGRLIGTIVALQAGGAAAMIVAYAIASLAGAVLQAVLAWRLGWREWDRAAPLASSRHLWRPLAHFGLHTSLTTTLLTTEQSLVPMLLGALASPTAAGLFAIALVPITVSATLTAPVRLLMFPEQAKLAAARKIAALRRSVQAYMRLALWVSIPLAIAGWFLFPWLIPLVFGDRYEAAVEPARIMLVAMVANFVVGAWAKTLAPAIGMPQLRSGISAVFLVIVVGLTVVLAPEHGATGAAVADAVGTVVTYAVWLILIARVLRRAERSTPAAPTGAA